MSDFHKKKAEEKANKKLVFSQKSLDDWKAAQYEEIRQKVVAEMSEKFAEQQKILADEKDSITSDAIDQAFVLLLGIPCKVMNEQYGWKSKRLTKFSELILEYYNEFQNGEMSIEAYRKMIWEQTGIGFTFTGEDESSEEVTQRYQKEMDDITE